MLVHFIFEMHFLTKYGEFQEEGGKKGKKEKEKEKENDKVILKVYMHCEACKKKVRKALKSLPGMHTHSGNTNRCFCAFGNSISNIPAIILHRYR